MELHARNCRIIHILWKPFSIILNKTNTTAVTGDAVIQAFASFIFLSSNNIYYVLVSVNVNNEIVDMHGNLYETALYFDPTITYLSHQHVLYALVPVVFLTFIPSVLLILYPTRLYSRYLSRCLSARIRLAITTFAEALHKCFKDGLNGTRTGWLTFHWSYHLLLNQKSFAGDFISSSIRHYCSLHCSVFVLCSRTRETVQVGCGKLFNQF